MFAAIAKNNTPNNTMDMSMDLRVVHRSVPENYDDTDLTSRKLFIGGLPAYTTNESLQSFFSQYGQVTDCVVLRDAGTGRSRCFGFVTFASGDELETAMKGRPHVVDGKMVDTKRALPREIVKNPESRPSVSKIFVSNISEQHDEACLRGYFGKFGNVVSVEFVHDKYSGLRRGFGFVQFDDYDAVDKCIIKPRHYILGSWCVVKKAVNNEDNKKARQRDVDRLQRNHRSRGAGRPSWSSTNFNGYLNDRFNSGEFQNQRSGLNGTGSLPGYQAQNVMDPAWNLNVQVPQQSVDAFHPINSNSLNWSGQPEKIKAEKQQEPQQGSDTDLTIRKLFIGGLPAYTSNESLQSFFSQYGQVTDCVVLRDAGTGRSRCFGFVTFASGDELETAMKGRPHVVDGKMVDTKRALPRELWGDAQSFCIGDGWIQGGPGMGGGGQWNVRCDSIHIKNYYH